MNTGAGSAFQTGLDVVQLSKDRDALREQSRRTRDAELRFTAWHNQVWKPVIASVNGVCAGGGLHFVADADIVVAASNATFLDPHVSIGQVAAYEDIALGAEVAGRVDPADGAGRPARADHRRAGVPARHPEPGRRPTRSGSRPRPRRSPRRWPANSPAAMRATKRALWGALEMGLTDACKAGAEELVSMWGHPDQTEGPLAFAEKRDARWSTDPDPTRR